MAIGGYEKRDGRLDSKHFTGVKPTAVPVIRAVRSPTSGRPNRRIRLPRRYRDDLPPNPNSPIIAVSEPEEEPVESPGRASFESRELPKSTVFCTEMNSFGVYRIYALGPPTITPDELFSLSSVTESISIARDPADSRSNASWWSVRAKPSEFTAHHIAYIPKVFQNLAVSSLSNRK